MLFKVQCHRKCQLVGGLLADNNYRGFRFSFKFSQFDHPIQTTNRVPGFTGSYHQSRAGDRCVPRGIY